MIKLTFTSSSHRGEIEIDNDKLLGEIWTLWLELQRKAKEISNKQGN